MVILYQQNPHAIVLLLKAHFLLCDPFTNGPFFFSLRRCELEPHLWEWHSRLWKGQEIIWLYLLGPVCVCSLHISENNTDFLFSSYRVIWQANSRELDFITQRCLVSRLLCGVAYSDPSYCTLHQVLKVITGGISHTNRKMLPHIKVGCPNGISG